MAFKGPKTKQPSYATPAELYRELPRRLASVPELWAHQAETLRNYTSCADKPDIAIELPTGTGKTLVGLLIAEWTLRKRHSRVIYACPTQQLARQVADAAYNEGIGTALLIGRHDQWNSQAQCRYEAAETIAITTYSSIFNSNPHLLDSDLILFDDAHAGEQYVGEAYGVDLSRKHDLDEYKKVLDTIAPALDPVFLERLHADEPDHTIHDSVRMVLPLRQTGMVHKLNDILMTLSTPHTYRYSMIQAGISSCLVYVAYSGILIRPYLPPTHQNHLFTNARQRIYLSATLGEGGELERAFGRPDIIRLKQQSGSPAPRNGRRFFVFPEYAKNADVTTLSRDIVKLAGKALILAPQTESAMHDAQILAQPEWPVLGIDNVRESMTNFTGLEHGVCGLAARYDGLDLPGDSCRLVVLDGVPEHGNLQERFLQSRSHADAALATRVRTRVAQGAGRCTRGPNDTALVLVRGRELSRYLSRPEVLHALDTELQAEIRFGMENSRDEDAGNMRDNVRVFLNQDKDDSWHNNAEPLLTEYRREAVQQEPAGTKAMSACVEHEVKAWAAATSGNWAEARKHAHEVARIVGEAGSATIGYRAFWTYLEAAWTDQCAEQNDDSTKRAEAKSLVHNAETILGLGSWIREMASFPEVRRSPLSSLDTCAVDSIASLLRESVNQGKIRKRLKSMQAGLNEHTPSKYEPALTEMGFFLGADAIKPTSPGRCDSTWCWGNELWLALEAKSDHTPTGVVSHKEIRQASDQLKLLKEDRRTDRVPPDSAIIIISPKPGVNSEGAKSADTDLYLIPPSVLSNIAFDLVSAWDCVLVSDVKSMTDPQLRERVEKEFFNRALLPSQIHERLTSDPISGQRRS